MGSKTFLLIFLVLLYLPLFQMVTGAVSVLPLDENRRLALPPSAETPWHRVPNIAERWFADHFGFRQLLVRAKVQLDWSLFGHSDRVFAGRDGQLFYRTTVNVEPLQIERMLAKSGDDIRRNTAAFAEALHRNGIGLIMTVNLLSDRLYPELLPADAVRRPDNPRIDQLISTLSDTAYVRFVDSTSILLRTKAERRIFHRTDFHWNDPAAYDVSREIVLTVARHQGQASPWAHPLEIVERRLVGGISAFLPIFHPPSEIALFTKQNWVSPARLEITHNPPYEVYQRFSPVETHLPPTVLVGDSFADAFARNGMDIYFSETWRIRWQRGLKLSDIVAALPREARWLVLQFIEVNVMALGALADEADLQHAIAILDARTP